MIGNNRASEPTRSQRVADRWFKAIFFGLQIGFMFGGTVVSALIGKAFFGDIGWRVGMPIGFIAGIATGGWLAGKYALDLADKLVRWHLS
jgi:hypothetical protein